MKLNADTLMKRPWSWLEQLLLRRAPQDDAFSRVALALALAAYLSVNLLQAASSSAWPVAVKMTLADTLVMVVFTWVVLQLAGKPLRLVQTLTALAGTGTLLGMMGLPLVSQSAGSHQAGGPTVALVSGWLVLLIWGIAVQAHIFRHALSTRYGYGLMVAGLHSVIAIIALETFFPRVMENVAG
jgi:hypothetical protein